MPQNAVKRTAGVKNKSKPANGVIGPAGPTRTFYSDAAPCCDAGISPKSSMIEASDSRAVIAQQHGQITKSSVSETMQLSLRTTPAGSDLLPNYPIADTIALILILVNFPLLVVTATHSLFSYREHNGFATTLQSSTSPPLFMILFIDAIVVIFTAVVLPTLRHTITDIAHIIVAISMSGAQWRLTFPFAISMAALRACTKKLYVLHLFDQWNIKEESLIGTIVHKLTAQFSRPFRSPPKLEFKALESNPLLDYIQSAVAIHIFSLGMIRLVRYWLTTVSKSERRDNENDLHVMSGSKSKRKNGIIESRKESSICSIWDHLLRWKAESTEKRQDLAQPGEKVDHVCNAWIQKISPTYLILGLKTPTTVPPSLTIHVNGLIWETTAVRVDASLSPPIQKEAYWTAFVDNLSPKTEYDVSLGISNASEDCDSYEFAVCTSTRDVKALKKRADSHVPTISTSIPDEVMTSSEALSGHPVGPPSPVTTLEESIHIASMKLEERRALVKKTRKDNSKKLQILQKEADHLTSRANGTNDKHDQRVVGRMLSLQTEIKRIQDSMDEMDSQKQETIVALDRQRDVWTTEKAKRDQEASILESIRQQYDLEKAQHQTRFAAVDAEASKIRAKADKLSMRRTKIQQDLDRSSAEQDNLLNREYIGRVSNRDAVRDQRLQAEADWLKAIHETQQRAELLELYGNQ